ncbi:MAG: hypothetical protein HC810_08285 [Acaryochloridaceae cyanobacterium RL_2_7]|nr:hypothetical protein [Acaryochloridaceae cyanobacterium RL_2_7]
MSQFAPSYGMVLNLLQTHSFDECQQLIEKSFGQYLALKNLTPQQQAIQALEQEYAAMQQRTADADFEEIHRYQKLQQRLKVEKKLLKTLHLQSEELQSQDLFSDQGALDEGTVISLRAKSGNSSLASKQELAEEEEQYQLSKYGVEPPQSAVILRKIPGSGQFPYFLCLSELNHGTLLLGNPLWPLIPQRKLRSPL